MSAAWLSAQDADSLWNQAVKDYTEENYQAALDCFSALEAEGYVSRELYYNIGNCYYKLGNSLGQSILYYERALKLDPSYEDAQVNLAIAREYTLDRIDEVPEFILLTWIKAFRDTVSSDAWAWIALALFLVTAVMVLLFRFGSSTTLRKTAFSLAVAALLMTIISAVFAFNLRSALESDDEAVVTVPVSSVQRQELAGLCRPVPVYPARGHQGGRDGLSGRVVPHRTVGRQAGMAGSGRCRNNINFKDYDTY